MPVKCKICDKEMSKQITNTHLNTHSMTADEYKTLYGKDALICPDYRRQLSEKMTGKNNPNFDKKWSNEQKSNMSKQRRGRTPWNKGIKISGEILENIRNGIDRREERYRSGELVRQLPGPVDEERRKALSEKQSTYAKNNPEEMSKRGRKAIETRKNNGYDPAFFRDRKHSEETKKKISATSKEAGLTRTKEAEKRLTENAKLARCSVRSFGENLINLQCDECEYEFSFTKQYFTDSKLKINRCPVCYPRTQPKRSAGEEELYNFIVSLGVVAVPNHRNILEKREIDIYLPDHQIAVEYNGLYWHSEALLESIGQSKNKDNEKRVALNNLGIRYIAVFEDEWINKSEIVKSRLTNLLQKTPNIIHARKCEVRLIDSFTASRFCDANHIQGKGRSNSRYGLYYHGELVSVMTFSKSNLSRKIAEWELNRFCSKLNTNVVGGASRLFSAFIREHTPSVIITYADSRWSEGGVYRQLGFEFSHQTVPNYWYVLPNELQRIHRFALRKTKKDEQSKTEKQLRTAEGYGRIWDCGSTKWIWTANRNGTV
jgi:hypothetical protein